MREEPTGTVCATSADGSLTICWSRAKAVERRPDDRETRWCFRCRARLPHEWVLYAEPFPSVYDPWWALECSRCHDDFTQFPGTAW